MLRILINFVLLLCFFVAIWFKILHEIIFQHFFRQISTLFRTLKNPANCSDEQGSIAFKTVWFPQIFSYIFFNSIHQKLTYSEIRISIVLLCNWCLNFEVFQSGKWGKSANKRGLIDLILVLGYRWIGSFEDVSEKKESAMSI